MGTSRQLGVGPVAMVSLLVEVGLDGILTEEECPAYFAQGDGSSDVFVAEDTSDWEPQCTPELQNQAKQEQVAKHDDQKG